MKSFFTYLKKLLVFLLLLFCFFVVLFWFFEWRNTFSSPTILNQVVTDQHITALQELSTIHPAILSPNQQKKRKKKMPGNSKFKHLCWLPKYKAFFKQGSSSKIVKYKAIFLSQSKVFYKSRKKLL